MITVVQKVNEPRRIERLTVGASEASEMLGISPRTLWSLTKTGQIPSIRAGRRVLYPIDGLRKFVNATSEE